MPEANRPLSEAMARRCEEAGGPVCHCRCAGRLHGIARGGRHPARSFYEALPSKDPHHLLTAEEVEQQRQERLAAQRQERADAQRRKWDYLAELYRP